MRRSLVRLFPAAALALLILVFLERGGESRPASGIPSLPRLAAGNDGVLLLGFQIRDGDDGEYELGEWTSAAGEVAGRGRYRGHLAGLAVMPDGRFLALTRDGALATVEDDPKTLALPDSRWTMLALTWLDGNPAALNYSGGRFSLAVPDGDRGWREESHLPIRDAEAAEAVLVPARDGMHLFWRSRAGSLSRGAVRHARLEGRKWREEKPLPFGPARAMAAFGFADGVCLAAATVNPLDPDAEADIAVRIWRRGDWFDPGRLAAGTVRRLAEADSFAAVRGHWLVTGPGGAILVSRSGESEASELFLAPGAEPASLWRILTGLLLPVTFVVLALLHCRRSRLLSRQLPGAPADLTTRGAALCIDWSLVSLGIGAYHVAAGDINIRADMMTLDTINALFWASLAALALFAGVMEAAYGQTPGKRLAGIRVRSAAGGPPGVVRALIRNAARGLDMAPVLFPGLIGVATAMFNPFRQRLGDLFGGTLVRRHAPLRFRRVVLASRSPRRKELLEALGVRPRVWPADIDEDAVTGEGPEETVVLLAETKAKAAAAGANPTELIIAADTMVVLDGKPLGKPADADDAKRMLGSLSGRSHTVFTGVSLWDSATGQVISDVERTEVEFRILSDREIEDYVATGDPLDKAGAYGVQTGGLVKQVRGSLSNVAGLPMELLESMLSRLDS